MEAFIGVKSVSARKMTKEAYCTYRGWEVSEDEDPDAEGYLVEYMDSPNSNHPNHRNYISWSPKDVFEKAYTKIEKVQSLSPVFPTKEVSVGTLPSTDIDYNGAHAYVFKNCVGWVDGMTKYSGGEQLIQFVQKNEDGTIIPGLQNEQLLIALIDRMEKLNAKFPCRENSIMITKLQEALHWQEHRVKNRINRGVMGELKK